MKTLHAKIGELTLELSGAVTKACLFERKAMNRTHDLPLAGQAALLRLLAGASCLTAANVCAMTVRRSGQTAPGVKQRARS